MDYLFFVNWGFWLYLWAGISVVSAVACVDAFRRLKNTRRLWNAVQKRGNKRQLKLITFLAGAKTEAYIFCLALAPIFFILIIDLWIDMVKYQLRLGKQLRLLKKIQRRRKERMHRFLQILESQGQSV